MSSGEDETVRVWIGTGEPPPDAPTVSIPIGEEVWRAGDIRAAYAIVPTGDGTKVVAMNSNGTSTVLPIEDFPLVEELEE